MLIYLKALLTGGKIVYLMDTKQRVYKTIAYKHKMLKGVMWAHVYPHFMIGHVILREDGTTTGESCYIEKWSYARDTY